MQYARPAVLALTTVVSATSQRQSRHAVSMLELLLAEQQANSEELRRCASSHTYKDRLDKAPAASRYTNGSSRFDYYLRLRA